MKKAPTVPIFTTEAERDTLRITCLNPCQLSKWVMDFASLWLSNAIWEPDYRVDLGQCLLDGPTGEVLIEDKGIDAFKPLKALVGRRLLGFKLETAGNLELEIEGGYKIVAPYLEKVENWTLEIPSLDGLFAGSSPGGGVWMFGYAGWSDKKFGRE